MHGNVNGQRWGPSFFRFPLFTFPPKELGFESKLSTPYNSTVAKQKMPNGDDATATNGILNGIPDWVYEEEMLSSRSATWWSPNGDNVVFLKFDTSQEQNVEYDYYGPSTDQRGRADDFTVESKDDQVFKEYDSATNHQFF